MKIEPQQSRQLAEAGVALKALLAEQVAVSHPELPGMTEISYVMFRGTEPDGAVRTCTILSAGRVDRSPCGTGSSANLATLYARGKIKVGDRKISRSTTGGEFIVDAIGETTVANRRAVLPRITGQAWIYGREELRVDRRDPFPKGFVLSDSWHPSIR
jgi:proline racemase